VTTALATQGQNHSLAIREERANQIIAGLDIRQVGEIFAKSGYFADAREAAQCMVKVLAGREMGMGPFAAMSSIHIIKGKPSAGYVALGACVKRSGRHDYKVIERTEKAAEIEFFRDKVSLGKLRFTIADAVAMGLASQDNYRKQPAVMLFARAMSQGVRTYCPEVTNGPVYTPDELGAAVNEQGEPVTPPAPGAPKAARRSRASDVLEEPAAPKANDPTGDPDDTFATKPLPDEKPQGKPCPASFDDPSDCRDAMVDEMMTRWVCSKADAVDALAAMSKRAGADSFLALSAARKALAWTKLTTGELKTQTRRMVKPQPEFFGGPQDRADPAYWGRADINGAPEDVRQWRCPYGQPGDHLRVNESDRDGVEYDGDPPREVPPLTFDGKSYTGIVWYEADGPQSAANGWGRLRPPRFMMGWMSRLTLEVVSVRVERVESIRTEDAVAEGFDNCTHFLNTFYKINKRAPDGSNPWVWAIEFKRIGGGP
jgi:hypothetical protein